MGRARKELDVVEAITALQAIPEGKLVDFVTGKLLDDTPEEYVRQNIAMSLVLEYGYDRSQIAVEFPIKIGSKTLRVDLAVFPSHVPHQQENIAIIVETKKQGTKPEDKIHGVEQLKSYMSACANCSYGMWTNGDFRACYQKVFDGRQYTFLDAIDIPPNGVKRVEAPTRAMLRVATGHNLLFAFRRCHNYIAGNQGLQKPEAFWELLKLIFCKIEDERSSSETLEFYVSQSERASMNGQSKVKARIQRLFKEVVKKYPTIFKPNDDIELDARVTAYVVSELQQYSLLSSPVDVKGVAYEEIVGSNLRGDRGEFFTPRNACRMAVRMLDPRPHERLLDPACGTGGFLVIAMNHALRILEETERAKWRDPFTGTQYEMEELYRKKAEYLSQKVFGLDLNPNLVRAAKMNMVMNNDGSGNLYQCNSLEHPHRWSDEVRERVPLGSIDVLFTNPPFGSQILIDDPAILAQYDLAAQWELSEDGKWGIKKARDGSRLFQAAVPPEILFVERCLQWLKPGTGRMAIVMPNGLLNNPGLGYLRQWLLSKA